MFLRVLTALTLAAVPLVAQTPEPSLWKSLRFRHIGPEGNRVSSVAGVAGSDWSARSAAKSAPVAVACCSCSAAGGRCVEVARVTCAIAKKSGT